MDILENQHVQRRSKDTFLKAFQSGKQWTYGGSFVGQIRQNPASFKRRRTSKPKTSGGLFKKWFFPASPVAARRTEFARRANPVKKAACAGFEQQAVRQTRGQAGGFSFRVPSIMTMLVIAGILVFSMIVLNWPGLSLPSSFSLKLGDDELLEQKLSGYAGIPSLDVPMEYTDIPLNMIETFEWVTHKVKKGESVYKIARDFGISMDAIITSNNITDARRLAEGTVLRIPNIDGIPYTVKSGDNLSKISASMKIPLEVILDVNDMRTDTITAGQVLFMPGARMAPEALKRALGELFVYPVKGRLTDSYGFRISPITNTRSFHGAIDLAAPSGTLVRAPMDGKVVSIGNNRIYGKFIVMSHIDGYETLFAHLSSVAVNQGEKVRQGAKIGEVGSTGESTGPHLHFAVYKNKRAVNPLDLLH